MDQIKINILMCGTYLWDFSTYHENTTEKLKIKSKAFILSFYCFFMVTLLSLLQVGASFQFHSTATLYANYDLKFTMTKDRTEKHCI